jgi:hypothetical protein
MANDRIQVAIGVAVRASYAGGTVLRDDTIFEEFCAWTECEYGFVLASNVDYFNSESCRRHRVESVAGFLTGCRNPSAYFHSLRRCFTLHSLLTDMFVAGGTAANVVKGMVVLRPPTRRPKSVGVTSEMLAAARVDASDQSMLKRMLGLSALYAYSVGARVGEFATTRSAVYGGYELNKHTVLRSMVRIQRIGGIVQTVEVYPRSTKTTGPLGGRPKFLSFPAGNASEPSEKGLTAFLCAALVLWLDVSGGADSDPLFSYRHGVYRKQLTRSCFSTYTKDLGSSCGLDRGWLSSKSWKVGKVSRGVERGETEAEVVQRGNHRSVSANRHYRPVVRFADGGSVSENSPPFGISSSLAQDEIRRDRFRLGMDSSSDSSDSD